MQGKRGFTGTLALDNLTYSYGVGNASVVSLDIPVSSGTAYDLMDDKDAEDIYALILIKNVGSTDILYSLDGSTDIANFIGILSPGEAMAFEETGTASPMLLSASATVVGEIGLWLFN